jgi:hypothetical protein
MALSTIEVMDESWTPPANEIAATASKPGYRLINVAVSWGEMARVSNAPPIDPICLMLSINQ